MTYINTNVPIVLNLFAIYGMNKNITAYTKPVANNRIDAKSVKYNIKGECQMFNKMERMQRVERKRMVKGKQWLVLSTTALALGAVAFGGTEASAAEYTPETWVARSPEEIVIEDRANYLIIWGDTLWAISEASGVSVDALVQINSIANRDLIYAGNTLVIDGQIVTVTEQNGQKSSFVVEGDSVTQTDQHVEGVKASQPAVAVTTPQANVPAGQTATETVQADAKEDNTSDAGNSTESTPAEDKAVEEDKGGNFAPVENETPATDNNTDVNTDVDTDTESDTDTADDADEDVNVEDGGNFTPVAPVTPVEDEDEEVEDGGNFTPVTPVEDEEEAPVDAIPDEEVLSEESARITIDFDLGADYSRTNPFVFNIPNDSAQYGLYILGGDLLMTRNDEMYRALPMEGMEFRFDDSSDPSGRNYITVIINTYGVYEEPVLEEEEDSYEEDTTDNQAEVDSFVAFLNANLEGEFEAVRNEEDGYNFWVGSDSSLTPDNDQLQADYERVLSAVQSRGYNYHDHNGGDFYAFFLTIN